MRDEAVMCFSRLCGTARWHDYVLVGAMIGCVLHVNACERIVH